MDASTKRSYWLYIHPYVYISAKKDHAILYNTLNGKLLEYKEEPEILRLINRLKTDRNLYVVKLSSRHITPGIGDFIRQIRQAYVGDIVDTALSSTRPVQFKPILSLQRILEGATSTEKHNKRLAKDEIFEYLNTISIYLNDACDRDCRLCSRAYKQFLFCHKNKKGKNEVPFGEIKKLLEQTASSNLAVLNILGGNILKYSRLGELIKLLNSLSIRKEYFIHYLNMTAQPDLRDFFTHPHTRLNVLVHFPVEPEIFAAAVKVIDTHRMEKMFHLVIQEEADMEAAEELISTYRLEHIRYNPYFNGKNIGFFEQHVFLTRESIQESRPSLKEILTRTSINPIYFKKIYVLGNGSIHANINGPKIGELGRSYIFDLLDRELNRGRSWTKIRKHVAPCKHCVFHALCPPISNYEYVLGRYNLCHETNM